MSAGQVRILADQSTTAHFAIMVMVTQPIGSHWNSRSDDNLPSTLATPVTSLNAVILSISTKVRQGTTSETLSSEVAGKHQIVARYLARIDEQLSVKSQLLMRCT